MTYYTSQLLKWFNKNKRDLPWRKTSDPYKVWLSEIILQQTRIDQGTAYYLRFIKEFPDIFSLARARQEKVIKLWQGLGYYSRARNLHETAKQIVQEHNGRIPDQYEEIIKLKGIGDYTAGAILSIAYNKPYPVVDGNVLRVISRLFGITKPIDSSSVLNEIRSKAIELMPEKDIGDFNQALMEFGALQCVPQNPLCTICCMKSKCIAFRENMANGIPKKKNIVKIKTRYLNYFLVSSIIKKDRIIYLRKRTFNDIWRNLYDLPCIEREKELSFAALKKSKEWEDIFGNSKTIFKTKSETYTHKLSHQTLIAVFFSVEIDGKLSSFKEIKTSQLNKFPIPKLIENYFTDEKLLK